MWRLRHRQGSALPKVMKLVSGWARIWVEQILTWPGLRCSEWFSPWTWTGLSLKHTMVATHHLFLTKPSLTLESFSGIPPICSALSSKNTYVSLVCFSLKCLFIFLLIFSIEVFHLFVLIGKSTLMVVLFHHCCLFVQDSHPCSSSIIP